MPFLRRSPGQGVNTARACIRPARMPATPAGFCDAVSIKGDVCRAGIDNFMGGRRGGDLKLLPTAFRLLPTAYCLLLLAVLGLAVATEHAAGDTRKSVSRRTLSFGPWRPSRGKEREAETFEPRSSNFRVADDTLGTTSRHIGGMGVSRPSGLFSSGLRRLSCRVSIGNEASRGRSPAGQSPSRFLSP